MKNFIDTLLSETSAIILLSLLTIAMAIATFIENSYDTAYAKYLVYNAKWFEFLFLLLTFNLIGNIKKFKLYKKGKLAILLFHLSFILMIIGAGVTRYIGFEGSMHIREGESSNYLYSSVTYFQVSASDENYTYNYDLPINQFELDDIEAHIKTEDKGDIDISFNRLIINAQKQFIENVEGGTNIIDITVAKTEGNRSFRIKEGSIVNIGGMTVAYNNSSNGGDINITGSGRNLKIQSVYDIFVDEKSGVAVDTIMKDVPGTFKEDLVYSSMDVTFLYAKQYISAKEEYIAGNVNEQAVDAIIVDVEFNGKKTEVPIFGGADYYARFQESDVEGISLKMSYGQKIIELPFSIYLNDFILDRYAGSMSPSAFQSDVTLIDDRYGINEPHSIFMNNVLDYDGYRFFQSSYDPKDERGTVLSVNHDFAGTWISYAGYFFLGLGFVLTMFSKKSRFLYLLRSLKKIEVQRKTGALTVLLLLGISGAAFSQENNLKVVSSEHADKFGRLIVQTYDGRSEPVHTLVYDLMHKMSREDKFDFEGVEKMDAMQMFLEMMVEPEFWKNQYLIHITDQPVRDILGIAGKKASYNDFMNEKRQSILREYAEAGFQKKKIDQNQFDRGIFKAEERLNVCMKIFNGGWLNIFPNLNPGDDKWVNINNQGAHMPITGSLKMLNNDLQLQNFTYANFFQLYLDEVKKAKATDDYTRADQILGYLDNIQRQSSEADVIPSESMVDFEIHYNKSQIFIMLRNIYGVIAMFLMVLVFIDILRAKRNRILSILITIGAILLGAAFLYHTYGMILRWYLSGHAPWSNGYEALILVAWGGVLAGFSFIRFSKIPLALTALLAFFMLMTAGHSSYDPQLTNLVPVLKSYWLIIHVATLTISYGFLGLSFFIGFFNMLIYILKNNNNKERLDIKIKELTHISEMLLTVGIVLATVGTFLGGVWANESWGRYWGWDPKETWALIIVVCYAVILHLRFVPKLRGAFVFNVGAIFGFASVIMTFIGVNYYFTKGQHSYGSGESTPVFPMWAWILILSLIALIVIAGIRQLKFRQSESTE